MQNNSISLKLLSKKTATLISLIAIPRGKSLHKMDTALMSKAHNKITFHFITPSKTSKPGKCAEEITLHRYTEDVNLCPVNTNSYLQRTQSWRENRTETCLFLSFNEPHFPVEKCSIARWVKDIMKMANINTDHFQAHSLRSASSSKANRQGVSLQDILKRGNWSQESTWQKFYHNPEKNLSLEYQNHVLKPNNL